MMAEKADQPTSLTRARSTMLQTVISGLKATIKDSTRLEKT